MQPTFFQRIRETIKKNPLTVMALALGLCALLLVATVVATAAALAGVNREIGDRNERLELLKGSLAALTDDYNLLRSSLGLEPRDFPVADEASASGDKTDRSPLSQGLAVIQSRYYDEARAKRFEEFKSGALFKALPGETGCAPIEDGLFSVAWVKKNNVYYSLAYLPDTDGARITAAGTREQYAGNDKDAAVAFIRATLKPVDAYYERVAAIKKDLIGLGANEAVAAALRKKGLTFQYRGEEPARFRAAIGREKEDLLTVSFDKREGVYTLGEKKLGAPENLIPELERALETLDARTIGERRRDAVAGALSASFRDPEFQSACREAAMEVAAAPRENEDFIFYDVRHRGEKIGAFAVNQDTADVYFVDKDDVIIASLQSLAGAGDLKKKTVAASADPSVDSSAESARSAKNLFPVGAASTFLLLGRNEENTDTMILVQADARTKSLKLVSLPRDLYYNGAKINRLHQNGLAYCAREISSITGVPVEKFAAVDLYSLISLIDVLGGVDVDLPFDLIDPTYRIKENGVWRTLAYPRGHYHFSGVQALRVIRSRGTSSDFQRAHRQQLVLAALFDKLKTRCGQSLEAALSVFSALTGYVTTNVSPLEIARYFIMFKDYRIAGAYVIDTTNILRATYSALYRLPEEEQKKLLAAHDEKLLGAYILLPRNNDWNLIRSYIRVLLAGGEKK